MYEVEVLRFGGVTAFCFQQQCLYLYCCAPRLEGWWGTFSSSSIFVVSALFQRVGSGGASGARSEIGDLLTVRCSRLVRSTRFR
ncbi:hypothetical protein IGI04_001897 [Brassica rapa subsp. trilocularis]|uniref:Secreted protein n=1 Tax=Brassica rapa subsp. trilocularis TaxID=1813537 RepID=A0ABQ7NTX1_BRACM|nr:hypothetical protein IGI04_001897 [Brassica rapa subsp. trilocularis]